MIEHRADKFYGAATALASLRATVGHFSNSSDLFKKYQTIEPVLSQMLQKQLDGLAVELDVLQCAHTLDAVKRLSESLISKSAMYYGVDDQIRDIHSRLSDELASIRFFAVRKSDQRFFAPALFGQEVRDRFPGLEDDIEESGKCLAFGRGTACVFHLMRVVEIGVQRFAEALQVSAVDSRGKERNWHNFLDQANKRVRAMQESQPPEARAAKLAAISSNLYAVKLAWRNEVMHPKASYTIEEAEEIFFATRSFMRELASMLTAPIP